MTAHDERMHDLSELARRRAVVRLDDGAIARVMFAPRPDKAIDRQRRMSRRQVKVQLASGKYLSIYPERIARVLTTQETNEIVALLAPRWKDR